MAKRNPIFQVGEIVTHVYSASGRIPPGAEVEIVGPLMLRDIEGVACTRGYGVMRCYIVSYEGHPDIEFYSTPDQLRKLDPPGDPLTLVQWSECPWRPSHEHSRKETAPR
jgi:hypothetical protein